MGDSTAAGGSSVGAALAMLSDLHELRALGCLILSVEALAVTWWWPRLFPPRRRSPDPRARRSSRRGQRGRRRSSDGWQGATRDRERSSTFSSGDSERWEIEGVGGRWSDTVKSSGPSSTISFGGTSSRTGYSTRTEVGLPRGGRKECDSSTAQLDSLTEQPKTAVGGGGAETRLCGGGSLVGRHARPILLVLLTLSVSYLSTCLLLSRGLATAPFAALGPADARAGPSDGVACRRKAGKDQVKATGGGKVEAEKLRLLEEEKQLASASAATATATATSVIALERERQEREAQEREEREKKAEEKKRGEQARALKKRQEEEEKLRLEKVRRDELRRAEETRRRKDQIAREEEAARREIEKVKRREREEKERKARAEAARAKAEAEARATAAAAAKEREREERDRKARAEAAKAKAEAEAAAVAAEERKKREASAQALEVAARGAKKSSTLGQNESLGLDSALYNGSTMLRLMPNGDLVLSDAEEIVWTAKGSKKRRSVVRWIWGSVRRNKAPRDCTECQLMVSSTGRVEVREKKKLLWSSGRQKKRSKKSRSRASQSEGVPDGGGRGASAASDGDGDVTFRLVVTDGGNAVLERDDAEVVWKALDQ